MDTSPISLDIPPIGQPGKNGRPLATTKRAAQNRAAQRAFRQRKECYIKDLETKVVEIKNMKEIIDGLRQENLQLRDYILALQSRLIEQPGVGGVPTPPAVYAQRSVEYLHDAPSNSVGLSHSKDSHDLDPKSH
ncbi:hypothetical protein V1512DRAFT_264584 [Lipomyces arxii]|uniref:uncharacterized protein n=1 Tax=Lipomyces arxii TaxID=56418 RepID=UPI0034CE07F7